MSDNNEIIDDNFKNVHKRIERIEQNIDYARFEIQEQRIEALEKEVGETGILKEKNLTSAIVQIGYRKEIIGASGGEKEVKINQKNLGVLAGQTPAILNDSKPPEPIDCNDCRHNSNYTGKHCIDTVGFCNGLDNDKFEPKEDRLPGGTGGGGVRD